MVRAVLELVRKGSPQVDLLAALLACVCVCVLTRARSGVWIEVIVPQLAHALLLRRRSEEARGAQVALLAADAAGLSRIGLREIVAGAHALAAQTRLADCAAIVAGAAVVVVVVGVGARAAAFQSARLAVARAVAAATAGRAGTAGWRNRRRKTRKASSQVCSFSLTFRCPPR